MDERPINDRAGLARVRRHLLAGAVSPHGAAAGVGASWHRVRAAGLSPGSRSGDDLLDEASLNALRADNEHLVALALPELENLGQQIDGSRSAVLLTDANGIILERHGDPHFRERSQRVALSPGACWDERVRGTNAIGLALAQGQSASVHGPEHFLECNTFLTCAAAPIRDARGTLIGLLDVSGDQSARQVHSLGLVRMGARMIENRVLMAAFPEALILRFHARPELLGTLGEGIVALAGDSRVLAMNDVARTYFPALADDAAFESLFEAVFEKLLASDSDSLMLRTTAGITVCLRLIRPERTIGTHAPMARAPDRSRFANLHAGDAEVEATLSRAQRVFSNDIPLLIEGETGTGKEWMVRALHEHGPRPEGPLVNVNCAAIPETLAEAELFGYVPGAFTGASAKGADGRIVEANGGTLFLDEIGDMPIGLQTRLLRVIQERSVLPVGGGRPRPVTFSLVSATHCNLADDVADGRFRADLYYRLCGLSVQLPPLRQRTDLVGLIERILMTQAPGVGLSDAVWERLLNARWPGNLRQLHNTLRTAVALRRPGRPVDLDDLPADLGCGPSVGDRTLTPVAGDLRDHEHRHMASVLADHGGNYSAAARALGISRSTLYRRLGCRR